MSRLISWNRHCVRLFLSSCFPEYKSDFGPCCHIGYDKLIEGDLGRIHCLSDTAWFVQALLSCFNSRQYCALVLDSAPDLSVVFSLKFKPGQKMDLSHSCDHQFCFFNFLALFENRILRRIFGPKGDVNDHLVGLVASMSDYWSWGRGFDPGTSTNFKCGLGLGRGPPSLVRTIG